MDKIVGEFDKCDECESLVDVYVEFHSRRGDLVKVCMNCLASAIVRPTPRAADVAGVCANCGFVHTASEYCTGNFHNPPHH